MIGPITTCIDGFVELNMSNYGQDEVDALQAWAFEALEELKWKHPEWVRLHELADSNRQIIDKLLSKRAWTREQDVEATSAVHFMLKLGYTYTGAGEWILLNHDPVIGFDQGKPGGDRTVTATFELDGKSLKLKSLLDSVADRQVVGMVCAASVGGVHCQSIREPGGLFCAHHKRAKSRMYLPSSTDERKRGVWAPVIWMSREEARKLYPAQEEPPCQHDWVKSSVHDAPDYCAKCGEDKPEFDDV
jgi:hypothetical protein